MKKLLLLTLSLLFLITASWASRPLGRLHSYRQSDGTYIKVQRCGDGLFGYFRTQDGRILLPNESHDLCYAVMGESGITFSDVVAHDATLRSNTEKAFVTTRSLSTTEVETAIQKKGIRRLTSATSSSPYTEYGQAAKGIVPSIGSLTIPVIMVGFTDQAFNATTTKNKVTRFFNEEGYSDEQYTIGSVHDYFYDLSEGLFSPAFEVVDSLQVAYGYAYYGTDTPRQDYRCKTLVQESLDSAVAHGVDFSKYATDANGVPLVIIYYAGCGEHDSYGNGSTDYIWPHFSTTQFTAGSTKVKSYFVGNEMVNDYDFSSSSSASEPTITGQRLEGMGICVHEFGHALGLPDFYNTAGKVVDSNGDTIKNMDYWSVMDYGQYAYNGYRPVGYNVYERAMLGWQKVVKLTAADTTSYYRLGAFGSEDDNTCYLIANPNNANEFLLLENRQPAKWYPTLFGKGLLMLHVDYNASAWSANTLNNTTSHPRFTYVPADGHKEGINLTSGNILGYKNDLFANGSEKYSVSAFDNSNDTYKQWAAWFTGTAAAKLYDIQQKDGIISFTQSEKLTAIDNVTTDEDNTTATYYTTDGRQVSRPTQRGIYIRLTSQGAKKIYVK